MSTLRPLEKHWHEYRESALASSASWRDVRTARMAFYAAASAVLAELAASNGSAAVIAQMCDEIDELLFELVTTATKLPATP